MDPLDSFDPPDPPDLPDPLDPPDPLDSPDPLDPPDPLDSGFMNSCRRTVLMSRKAADPEDVATMQSYLRGGGVD